MKNIVIYTIILANLFFMNIKPPGENQEQFGIIYDMIIECGLDANDIISVTLFDYEMSQTNIDVITFLQVPVIKVIEINNSGEYVDIEAGSEVVFIGEMLFGDGYTSSFGILLSPDERRSWIIMFDYSLFEERREEFQPCIAFEYELPIDMLVDL